MKCIDCIKYFSQNYRYDDYRGYDVVEIICPKGNITLKDEDFRICTCDNIIKYNKFGDKR